MKVDDLVTTEEVASILRISPDTIRHRDWQKDFGCPSIKIGKRRYWEKSKLWKHLRETGYEAEKF